MKRPSLAALAAIVAATVAGCHVGTEAAATRPPATVMLFPRDTSILEGRGYQVRATVLDSLGDTLRDVVPTFISTDTTVVGVTASGTVTSVGSGPATIVAIAGTASGQAVVTVVDTTILAHIAMTGQPSDIAVGASVAYVTTLSAVLPLDLTTLATGAAVTGTFSVPSDAIFNAARDTAYVSNQGSSLISVLDAAGDAQTATIATGGSPVPLAVAGADLFVATNDDSLHRISLATGSVTSSLVLPAIGYHILLRPDSLVLYVSTPSARSVEEIDGSSMAIRRTFAVGTYPQGMALSPDLRTLYVADEGRPYLYAVSLAGGLVADSIALRDPAIGLAISADGTRLYAGLSCCGWLQVIDRATGHVVRTVSVGGAVHEIRFDAAHQRVLEANGLGWVDVLMP